MAVPHANPGEVIALTPLDSKLLETRTTTLFKTKCLEGLRLVLPAGKRIDPHKVSGEITIQCLKGVVEIESRGRQQLMTPETLIYLLGGDEHSVRAIEDSALLVTIRLPTA
ncbi:MAG: cupin [Pirellulales bacterium]